MLIISCKKNKEIVVVEEASPVESLSLFDENTTYNFNEELKVEVREKIASWDEFFTLSGFLKKNFTSISPSFALELSKELTDLSKAMNDSLKILELNNRGMFARLNVFYSEAIRLEDMSTISSIKASEVNEQVGKLMTVYNSINMKINSIYLQKSFDNNVNFDESIFEFNKKEEEPFVKPKKTRRKKIKKDDKPSFRK